MVEKSLPWPGIGLVYANQLIEWTEGEAYEITSATYDADNVITDVTTVKWPDGSGGIFHVTNKNVTWLAVDGYTITHAASGLTVTQLPVTRDLNGNVTTKPALTVA